MKKRTLLCMLVGCSIVTVFSTRGAPKKSPRRKFNWSKLIPKFPQVPQISMALPSLPSVAVSNPFTDQHAVLASDRKPARWKVLFSRFARNARKSARSKVNGVMAVGPNTVKYVRSKECTRMMRRAIKNTAYYGFWYGIPAAGFLGGVKYLGGQQKKILDNQIANEDQRAKGHDAVMALLGQVNTNVQAANTTLAELGAPAPAALNAQIGVLDTRTQEMAQDLQVLTQELQRANGVVVGGFADENAAYAFFTRCMMNKSAELERRLDSGTFEVAKERILVDAGGTRYTLVPIQVKRGWTGPHAQQIWEEEKGAVQRVAHAAHHPVGADPTTVVLVPYCIESGQLQWLNR